MLELPAELIAGGEVISSTLYEVRYSYATETEIAI